MGLTQNDTYNLMLFFRYRDGTPLSEDWQIVPLSKSSKDFSSKKELFTFESSAILSQVDSNHSGEYECHPDKLEAVSVNLHVVKGMKYESKYYQCCQL